MQLNISVTDIFAGGPQGSDEEPSAAATARSEKLQRALAESVPPPLCSQRRVGMTSGVITVVAPSSSVFIINIICRHNNKTGYCYNTIDNNINNDDTMFYYIIHLSCTLQKTVQLFKNIYYHYFILYYEGLSIFVQKCVFIYYLIDFLWPLWVVYIHAALPRRSCEWSQSDAHIDAAFTCYSKKLSFCWTKLT